MIVLFKMVVMEKFNMLQNAIGFMDLRDLSKKRKILPPIFPDPYFMFSLWNNSRFGPLTKICTITELGYFECINGIPPYTFKCKS